MKLIICAIIYNILVVYSQLLYSGTITDIRKDNQYIDLGSSYDCVVFFSGEYKDGSFFEASAVVISDNTILTAAHIVQNIKNAKIRIDNNEFIIENIITHTDFKNDFGDGDIAIGFSKQSFNLRSYPKLYTEQDEDGKLCVMVGYGITGTLDFGAKKTDSKKRGGYNKISAIENNMIVCIASDDLEMEFLIAAGDSGGGLFIDGKLAAINSCVRATDGSPDSTYTDESCHTRISKYYPWILEKIR